MLCLAKMKTNFHEFFIFCGFDRFFAKVGGNFQKLNLGTCTYLIGIQPFITNALTTYTMASSTTNLMRVIFNATQVAGVLASIIILVVLSVNLIAIFCYNHKDHKRFYVHHGNLGNHFFIAILLTCCGQVLWLRTSFET